MKRISLVILPIVISLLLCGCNGRSISDYSIVQGVGIDAENDQTVVSIQYLDFAKSTGATDSLADNITTVVKGESVNISDALSSASAALSRDLFFGQNKIIVFGADYIRNDITLGLDYLMRSVDSRPDVLVACSDTTAEDIISSSQHSARIPAESVYDLLHNGEKNGIGAIVTVNDLLRLYSSPTSDIYMPVLKEEDGAVSCTSVAVFSREKYAFSLYDDRCLAFLLMLGRVEDASLVLHDDQLGNVGVCILSDRCRKSVSRSDGKLHFFCDIRVDVTLDDVQNGITAFVGAEYAEHIENLVADKIRTDCLSVLNSCFVGGADPLEIGKYLAKYDPNIYSRYSENWRTELKNIAPDVSVSADLTMINDSSVG